MSKLSVFAVAGAMVVAGLSADAGAVRAAPLGPAAAACAKGAPAMLVRVSGFKSRTGVLRVQSYGGNPKRFFDSGSYLQRIEVPVPANGPVEICVPVAQSGTYAVSVRHIIAGEKSKKDGGGTSGNPQVSLMDLVFKRKPDPEDVAVKVDGSTVPVPVVLNYIQGGSFAPIKTARS